MLKTLGFAAGLAAVSGFAPPVLAATVPPAITQSNTFSGYNFANYIAVPGAVTAVIVVPPLNCKTTPVAGSAVAVGVGIQSVNSYARLYMACTPKHKAVYYPSPVLNGTVKSIPSHVARPGDKVEFAVSQSASQVTVSVIDLTRKFSVTINGSGSGTSEGILAGDFPVPGTTTMALPNFGTLTFSSAQINGYPFGAAGSGLQVDNLYTSSTLQIKTTYSTTNKETFATVFQHS